MKIIDFFEYGRNVSRSGVPASGSSRVGTPAVRRAIGVAAIWPLCGGIGFAAQQEIWHTDGELGDYMETVAGTGDVDDDGTLDFVVGAYVHSTVTLYSGRTREILQQVSELPGSSELGHSLAGPGDFDGDGVRDFVAGQPGRLETGIHFAGAVRFYSGADGSEIAAVLGTLYDEKLGLGVAALGDVNGDGYADVGATTALNRVDVYGGPDAHLIRSHYGRQVLRPNPSIAGIGDVDGDGRPDYVVGWPRDSTVALFAGKAVVHSGRTGAVIHEVYGDTGSEGDIEADHLGVSVTGVGDIDLDGIPDFAAGAPGAPCLGAGCGVPTQAMVRVYSGADAGVLHEWHGDEETYFSAGSMFGFTVYGGGDLTGDGYPEVLVSAPYDTDGALSSPGSINVYSGRTGERLWRILAETNSSLLRAAAVLGDIDHDGLDDFAVGNYRANYNGSFSGRVTLYAGDPGELVHHCAPAAASASRPMRIDASGALGIENNFLSLTGTAAVPGQTALFFYGSVAPMAPFGDGWLCTGPPQFRLGPPATVDPDGAIERALDFTQPPLGLGPGKVFPGSTWSFQLLCRDPQGPGPHAFQLSDALAITFPP